MSDYPWIFLLGSFSQIFCGEHFSEMLNVTVQPTKPSSTKRPGIVAPPHSQVFPT